MHGYRSAYIQVMCSTSHSHCNTESNKLGLTPHTNAAYCSRLIHCIAIGTCIAIGSLRRPLCDVVSRQIQLYNKTTLQGFSFNDRTSLRRPLRDVVSHQIQLYNTTILLGLFDLMIGQARG